MRIRRANAAWKAESTAEPRPRGQQWKSPGSCRNFARSNLWAKDGEHAKQQFSIIFGATFSAVKGRKRLTSFGNFVRRHKGFASLRSRLSREWSSICRKSMNGFGYCENYEFRRISAVDRNVLRLAIYEMLYRDDIP